MIFSKVLGVRSFMVLKRGMSIQDLKEIFLKSVAAVQPSNFIRNEVVLRSVARKSEIASLATLPFDSYLVVRGETYLLCRKCYMVGFGKAVLGMATEMEKVLGDHLERAIVSVPIGLLKTQRTAATTKIEFIEGAENNLPDENALRASQKVKGLVEGLDKDDLLIVLISGGGSALLPLPVPPITLLEKVHLIKQLSRNGANINELNCVRKKISLLKGGGLAELAYPCKVIALVLSDIVGDPLDLIASGPTVPDLDPLQNGIEILKKYNLLESAPESVRYILDKGITRQGLDIINGGYGHVRNYIIGNNHIAAKAAEQESKRRGYQSLIVSTKIEGDVGKIAKIYARLASIIADVMKMRASKNDLRTYLEDGFISKSDIRDGLVSCLLQLDFESSVCLIFAGEPTVVVRGTGKGGRNQQLALAFSVELSKLTHDSNNIFFLSCGTDGIDGPTDAAGAIAPNNGQGELDIISMDAYLENNDAYTFFERWNQGANLIKIGHTGTNVMDMHLLIVKNK